MWCECGCIFFEIHIGHSGLLDSVTTTCLILNQILHCIRVYTWLLATHTNWPSSCLMIRYLPNTNYALHTQKCAPSLCIPCTHLPPWQVIPAGTPTITAAPPSSPSSRLSLALLKSCWGSQRRVSEKWGVRRWQHRLELNGHFLMTCTSTCKGTSYYVWHKMEMNFVGKCSVIFWELRFLLLFVYRQWKHENCSFHCIALSATGCIMFCANFALVMINFGTYMIHWDDPRNPKFNSVGYFIVGMMNVLHVPTVHTSYISVQITLCKVHHSNSQTSTMQQWTTVYFSHINCFRSNLYGWNILLQIYT